jgi:hypothetical protein
MRAMGAYACPVALRRDTHEVFLLRRSAMDRLFLALLAQTCSCGLPTLIGGEVFFQVPLVTAPAFLPSVEGGPPTSR